ncbi:hypothetical protein NL108_017840 [Boleophthalmus pectinirostris]|nr:hypothetical protein NL108_017840 [Boleophthalmus pectinirostris]
MMSTKTIHFVVDGRQETAEFGPDCSDAEVKDLFLAAAEVGPENILKLFSSDGRVLKICSNLQENDQSSSYRLQLASDPRETKTRTRTRTKPGLNHQSAPYRLQLASHPCETKTRTKPGLNQD